MTSPDRSPLRLAGGLLLAGAAFLGLLPSARAAMEEAKDHVRAEVIAPGAGDPVGGEFELAVRLTIDEGWHVYGPGDPFDQEVVFKVSSASDKVRVGEFVPDEKPTPHKGEFDEQARMEYRGTVTYRARVQVLAPFTAETIRGEARVNACDASHCLPEGGVPFEAVVAGKPDMKVSPATGPSPPPPPPKGKIDAAPPPPAPAKGAIDGAFLLAALVAGLLTIATPCVFPMLPLTVSLLTKQAAKEPGRTVPNALAYAAGMFFSLAGIGLALAFLVQGGATTLALSWPFNLAIFVVFVALALSLFGMFDLTLPSFLLDWTQGKASKGGGTGLFFMGVTLALTSFSCAAPFAGALAVEARTDVLRGVVGMSVYAATFSLPFFLSALFPSVLQRLPRAGSWMNAVKVVMGFVELAAAFKFLRGADLVLQWGVFSREFVLAIWVACSLGAAVYLLGFIVLPHDTKAEGIGVGRLLWALLFVSLGIYMVPGVSGKPLAAVIDSFILTDDTGEGWIKNDLDYALVEAKEHGKPVFVDFSGYG